jgi:hypothetical protein
MTLIKGISSTLKKLKEAQITFTQDDLKLKETIALIISHSNKLSKILEGSGYGCSDNDNSSMFLTGRGSVQMPQN